MTCDVVWESFKVFLKKGEVRWSSTRWVRGRAARGPGAHNTCGCKLLLHRNFPQYDFPNLSHFVFVSLASLLSRPQMFLRNRRLIYGLVPVRFSYYVPYITNRSSPKHSDGYHLSTVIISVLFNTNLLFWRHISVRLQLTSRRLQGFQVNCTSEGWFAFYFVTV